MGRAKQLVSISQCQQRRTTQRELSTPVHNCYPDFQRETHCVKQVALPATQHPQGTGSRRHAARDNDRLRSHRIRPCREPSARSTCRHICPPRTWLCCVWRVTGCDAKRTVRRAPLRPFPSNHLARCLFLPTHQTPELQEARGRPESRTSTSQWVLDHARSPGQRLVR